MGRRKHLFYRKDWPRQGRKEHPKDTLDASPQGQLRVNEKVLFSVANTSYPTVAPVETVRKRTAAKSKFMKKKIARVCGLSACINWLASVCGYIAIGHGAETSASSADTASKAVILFFALVQVALVVRYWDLSTRYRELLRSAMTANSKAIPRLRESPRELAKCLLECAVQLVVPLPNSKSQWRFYVFGGVSEVSLDDALYIAVLMKNYHTLRFLYWQSRFAELRTQLFAAIANVEFQEGFLFRSFLAEYHIYLIIGIFGIMVIFSGIIEYIFEQSAESQHLSTKWNDFWLVTYTQLTIGYGEVHPMTFPGQVTMLLSCFFGVFTLGLLNTLSSSTLVLNLPECNLYSESLYSRHKQLYREQAIVLMQRWWRLMAMRKAKTIHAYTITSFYSQLRVYRSTLVDCQHVKDTRFERQIDAFAHSVQGRIRPLNEYLRPIQYSYTIVNVTQLQDVLRNQYKLSTMCDNLYKAARRNRGFEGHEKQVSIGARSDISEVLRRNKTARSSRSPRPPSVSSSQGRAKAKFQAYQNVIGRLIRDDTCSPSQTQ